MPSEKQDLRVVRTHKMIRSALVELLHTKDFDHIAVQDIVGMAMVNRATFYKYYSGKSDLAGAMIAELKQHYAELINARNQSTDLKAFIETALPAFYEKRRLILALWKIKTKRHHLYDDMFLMIKNNYISQAQSNTPEPNTDYQGEILATLMLSTARYYFERDMPIPVRQVWADIQTVLNSVQE